MNEANRFDALAPFARWAILRYGGGSYDEYLRSEPWREIRRAAVLAAGGQCEECRRSFLVVLEAHHLTYVRIGAEQLEDLEVLCQRCHRARHGAAMDGSWLCSA